MHDLRVAVRELSASPIVTAVAILSLGLDAPRELNNTPIHQPDLPDLPGRSGLSASSPFVAEIIERRYASKAGVGV